MFFQCYVPYSQIYTDDVIHLDYNEYLCLTVVHVQGDKMTNCPVVAVQMKITYFNYQDSNLRHYIHYLRQILFLINLTRH